MSHTTIAMLSVMMIVVFGVIVVCYPLIFNSERNATLTPTQPQQIDNH